MFLLAWRFTVGGIIWLLLFPAARRGWTVGGLMRSPPASACSLSLGLILQHIGLNSTSEAVGASLSTSLTILFVPLLLTFAIRKPPRPLLWLGVALATLGIWLMTGATPEAGLQTGEFLGLACAFAFSAYILAVNAAAPHDTPWRMSAGQFILVGIICFATCVPFPAARNLRPHAMANILSHAEVWKNVILMAAFPTIAAFGLLTHFQPRLDPHGPR